MMMSLTTAAAATGGSLHYSQVQATVSAARAAWLGTPAHCPAARAGPQQQQRQQQRQVRMIGSSTGYSLILMKTY